MKTWNQVILVNLALTAVGLRVWLDPWSAPGETALPDLVGATDPLGQVTRPVVHQDTPSFEQVRAGIGRPTRLRTTCARAASITSRG